MRHSNELAGASGQHAPSDPARVTRMYRGLSSRLPRWHAFDGTQSRIAPTWATTTERLTAKTITALTLAIDGRDR